MSPSEDSTPLLVRFGRFELDHACRELRLEGKPQPVQPLVFAVLCYLVRNRDRVVHKDELLEKLWPGTVVTESSLQKAISMARAALRRGDASEAIRTFPRQGYRFVAEVERGDSPVDAGAAQALVKATQAREDSLARSIQEYIAAGDRAEAVQAAVRLARIALDRMEISRARGWTLRAERLLDEAGRSRGHGLVTAMHSRIALFEGDHEECLRQAEVALAIGRELADPEVEALGLIDVGHASLCLGSVNRAIAHFDEAAALAMSGGLPPETTGLVYCSVIGAATNRGDWGRANEWTASYTRWCEQSSFSYYPGLCRLHRAEVYHTQGDLPAARCEIAGAAEFLERAASWAAGEAHRVQGQILLDMGDREGAEAEFRRSYECGAEPQPGYAWLKFVQGEHEQALRGLRRAIESTNWSSSERRLFLRVEEVSLALACGQDDVVRGAIDAVREAASDPSSTLALRAEAARAEGELALHEGRMTEAVAHLRAARDGWLSVGSPPNAARARARLAEALDALGDDDTAALERQALRATFLPLGGLVSPNP